MTLNKILLVINLFLLQSYLFRFNIGGYPTNLQEILISMNLITFFFESPIIKIWEQIKKSKVLIAFSLMSLISLIFVPIENNLDFLRFSKFLFFAIILTFIFLGTLYSEKERKTGIEIMGYGALAFGLFSATYNLLGYNVTPDQRLLGPLDSAVYLAYYLSPFFIFFSLEFFQNPKNLKKLIIPVIFLLLLAATKSMGAIGATILILLFVIIKNRLNKKLLIGTIILLSIASTGIFYTKILPTIRTDYSSLDERGQIWATSAHLLKDPKTLIFGTGLGQFEDKYIQNVDEVLGKKPLDYEVIQPHNIFLLFIFNFGILGLFFILFVFYKIAKQTIKSGKYDLRTLASFILLYFFIHGIIDTPIFKNDMFILLLTFLELTEPLNEI